MESSEIFGWFDAPTQAKPSFDPGADAPCAVCLRPLSPPVKTISLTVVGDSRSYFYRIHKGCESEHDQERIESALIDSRPAPQLKESEE